MEQVPSPRYEDMLIIFRHLYEACRRNNIPIDVTPNIEVSLIVQPGDTRYLAPRTFASSLYQSEMAMARWLARPYFAWKMQPKKITASDVLTRPVARGKGPGVGN
jgi:hypothetical protein